MSEKQPESGPDWGKLSALIALPFSIPFTIIACYYFGSKIDQYYQTGGRFGLIGLGVGLAAAVVETLAILRRAGAFKQ